MRDLVLAKVKHRKKYNEPPKLGEELVFYLIKQVKHHKTVFCVVKSVRKVKQNLLEVVNTNALTVAVKNLVILAVSQTFDSLGSKRSSETKTLA